jgi:hypothetical protein
MKREIIRLYKLSSGEGWREEWLSNDPEVIQSFMECILQNTCWGEEEGEEWLKDFWAVEKWFNRIGVRMDWITDYNGERSEWCILSFKKVDCLSDKLRRERWVMNSDDLSCEEIYRWAEGEIDSSEYSMKDNLERIVGEREVEIPDVVYHATGEREAKKILKEGLLLKNKSRGISNRGVGAAIFTSSDPGMVESYGSFLFEINLRKMISDGLEVEVAQEPDIERYMKVDAFCHKLGLETERLFEVEMGMDWNTFILDRSVPPEYLKLVEGKWSDGAGEVDEWEEEWD